MKKNILLESASFTFSICSCCRRCWSADSCSSDGTVRSRCWCRTALKTVWCTAAAPLLAAAAAEPVCYHAVRSAPSHADWAPLDAAAVVYSHPPDNAPHTLSHTYTRAHTKTQRLRYGDLQASIQRTHSGARGLRLEMSKVVK